MRPTLVFPFLNVYLHGGGPWPVIETQWQGFATSAEFRASVAQVLQLGLQHQVKGWVADDRRLGAVRPKDLKWVHEDLLLTMDQAGLQRFALLESADSLNRLTISTMYVRASPTISFEIRRFDNIEVARAWASGQV